MLGAGVGWVPKVVSRHAGICCVGGIVGFGTRLVGRRSLLGVWAIGWPVRARSLFLSLQVGWLDQLVQSVLLGWLF